MKVGPMKSVDMIGERYGRHLSGFVVKSVFRTLVFGFSFSQSLVELMRYSIVGLTNYKCGVVIFNFVSFLIWCALRLEKVNREDK